MRIQVLHLPPADDDDKPVFALVIDEAGPSLNLWPAEAVDRLGAKLGAKAVLVFGEKVEVL